MITAIYRSFIVTVFLAVILCVIYPLAVMGVGKLFFNEKANGGIIQIKGGKVVGAKLIGQGFTKPEYFHPRPSAAGNDGYDASNSSGSNLGPLSQKLYDRVKAAREQFRKENPHYAGPIPADALTASASGLDPEISVAAANYQADRVARARAVPAGLVRTLISSHAQGRWQGFIGEPRINVLELNLALDDLR